MDLGFPTLTADATLTVNILRNQAPPVFISEPYAVTIDRNQGIGSNIYRVTATDADTQVSCFSLDIVVIVKYRRTTRLKHLLNHNNMFETGR